jgi:hypothetical protein
MSDEIRIIAVYCSAGSGEDLTDLSLAPPFFSEGLRPRDLGELAVAVLAWNTSGILCVQKPMDMG